MKRFITKIIAFLLAPLLFILSMDFYLRDINTTYKDKYINLLRNKDKIELLILGNSHANYAINPYYISDFYAFNIANVRQQIYFDRRITTKALDHGFQKLKYVFISADYHSLITSSQGPRNNWSYYANGIEYKNQDYSKAKTSPFIWGYTPKVAFSFIKNDIRAKFLVGNTRIPSDIAKGVALNDTLYSGFIGLNGTQHGSFNNSSYLDRANSFRENPHDTERNEVIADLGEFIVYLKNRNIEPILISSPTYKEYNTFLNEKQLEKNEKDLDSISYNFNIQYWSFYNDSRFFKEDFYNQDHLNKKGAEKFSKILSQLLKEYDEDKTHHSCK